MVEDILCGVGAMCALSEVASSSGAQVAPETVYLLDARRGLSEGHFASTFTGSGWTTMYVDGVRQSTVEWAHFSSGAWAFVHLEARSLFDDDVTFMARYTQTTGFMKGRLAEVWMWRAPLRPYEVAIIASSGFNLVMPNNELIDKFALEEGSGSLVRASLDTTTSAATFGGPVWATLAPDLPIGGLKVWELGLIAAFALGGASVGAAFLLHHMGIASFGRTPAPSGASDLPGSTDLPKLSETVSAIPTLPTSATATASPFEPSISRAASGNAESHHIPPVTADPPSANIASRQELQWQYKS
ncbi:hypothetical protein CYMTET_33481 [Cymbomonas tetramitiformis]|uniref:Uncharacterized protein n=1 Tax=Cymbomonas tetramitiformis TaxID=36881 RepID=A0AAE0FD54_9CHLO|nr:hypothetical protein CYMTET_33481 [Cymbomonas tetramitiformis]